MDYSKLSLIEIKDGIASGKFTSEEVTRHFISVCEAKKDLNAVVEIFDDAIAQAKAVDEKIKTHQKIGKLAGVPIAIKDNILYKGKITGCGSNFMQDFVAPYNATVIDKLLAEDVVIIGRTNMDEFAMGGSTETSCYGPCHNAHSFDHVAGGSSGGSAVAVAAGMVPLALGTDTGGSVRQPSSYNGTIAIKPTYGTVSRYGIVAYASSLDQCAPIGKTLEDVEYVLRLMSGKDQNDATSITNYMVHEPKQKYTLGVCKELIEKFKTMPGFKPYAEAINKIKNTFDIVEVSIPHISNTLAAYYIIAPAEAASNLSRFDGVKYTRRSENAKDLESVYVESRSAGFGKEVKRRIMLGNYVLSSGYYDAYYLKAKKVQKFITNEFKQAFAKCDAIIMPTTTGTAFKIGEKVNDPVSMYLEDLFTVPANVVGVPALVVPYAKGEQNLPIGMQFIGNEKQEGNLFDIAKIFTKAMEVK